MRSSMARSGADLIFPAASFLLCVVSVSPARADMPASQVTTQPVGAGQPYPVVAAKGEGWFDVGGFCKVVDVGDLSWTSPPADGVPVFIPGPADQWENWRSAAPGQYRGQLTSTTCCRPQSNIATLCAGASNPTPISRQYGELGETDPVSATCIGPYGSYNETIPVTCAGDNGPDGQAAWQAGSKSDACSPSASVTYGGCSASCGGGSLWEQIYDSCGNLTAQGYFGPSCNTQSCCTPSWQTSCGGCNGSGTKTCNTYDANNCPGSGTSTFQQACSWVEVGNGWCTEFICYDSGRPDNLSRGCGPCMSGNQNYDTWNQYGSCPFGWNGPVGYGPDGQITSYTCYAWQ